MVCGLSSPWFRNTAFECRALATSFCSGFNADASRSGRCPQSSGFSCCDASKWYLTLLADRSPGAPHHRPPCSTCRIASDLRKVRAFSSARRRREPARRSSSRRSCRHEQGLQPEMPLPFHWAARSVVFVLDSKNSVAYSAAPSSLSWASTLLPPSRSQREPRSIIRQPLSSAAPWKSQPGTLSSARYLRRRQASPRPETRRALAAMIPDRDTLVLAQAPKDDNWDGLTKACKKRSGRSSSESLSS